MKQTTINIKNLLNEETHKTNLENLKNNQATISANETTVAEAVEGTLDIMNLLEESIEKGIFEELSFTTRNQIYSHLNNTLRYSKNAQQFLGQYNNLAHHISLTPLYWRTSQDENIEILVKELNSLKRKYKKTLKELKDSEENLTRIVSIKTEIENYQAQIQQILESAEQTNNNLSSQENEVITKTQQISAFSDEIESKRMEIIAFSTNVNKTESQISNIQSELKEKTEIELNKKIEKAAALIIQAENALMLKETEGISGAMSGRLSKLTNSNAKQWWLIGAVSFVLLTVFLGFLLTGGTIEIRSFKLGYTDTEKLGFVLGRIVVALMGISAAIFCSKQYLNLKNIEEDYEYKVVLTKSILAFSNKIKEIDKEKVAEYLTTVLSEIHQDPLRSRKKEKVGSITTNQLKELIDLIKKIPSGG